MSVVWPNGECPKYRIQINRRQDCRSIQRDRDRSNREGRRTLLADHFPAREEGQGDNVL